ncbi:hypothetical protein D3C76_906390 [compost metagenome]
MHPIVLGLGFDLYLHLGECQRMAERDQVGGLLGRHDAGDAGGGKDVALVVLAAQDQGQGGGRHGHEGFGAGLPFGDLLVGHVHHVSFTALVEMGQVHHFPSGVGFKGGRQSCRAWCGRRADPE